MRTRVAAGGISIVSGEPRIGSEAPSVNFAGVKSPSLWATSTFSIARFRVSRISGGSPLSTRRSIDRVAVALRILRSNRTSQSRSSCFTASCSGLENECMSRRAVCMAGCFLHEAARQRQSAAALMAAFIRSSQCNADAIIAAMPAELLQAFSNAKIYDLAHTYRIGMPHHPVHPPYLFGLVKAHGEYMRGDVSSAAEAIALGGHVGTHIDALCHFSRDGKVYGGAEVRQSYAGGQ